MQLRGAVLGGRDRKVDDDARLRVDRLAILQVGFKSPLPHRFPCGSCEDRRTADDAQILNRAIAPDECVENDLALNFHLSGQQRVIGVDRADHSLRGFRRQAHFV